MKESRLQTALLVAVLGMSAAGLFKAKAAQRFVPLGDSQEIALDTFTGQSCLTVTYEGKPDPKIPETGYPKCKDLR